MLSTYLNGSCLHKNMAMGKTTAEGHAFSDMS